MKVLILLFLFVACKIEKEPTPPIISNNCIESECDVPVNPPAVEEPVVEEPVVEIPVSNERSYFYNHSLYLKSFTFWGFNFVSDDRINANSQVEFTSTNTTKVVIGSQYKRVYAKILFRNDESVKIKYINNSTDVLEETHERNWVIYDDLEFHIDGYKFGSFGWHSKIIPTLKNDNEIDDGVEKFERIETVYVGTKCRVNSSGYTECAKQFQVTDIYSRYYFDD